MDDPGDNGHIPDQLLPGKVKRTIVNRKTGELYSSHPVPLEKQLTRRETEILVLIRQGMLSKEIADK